MSADRYARLAIVAPLKTWGGLERKFSILCDEFLRLGVQPELWQLRGNDVPYPNILPADVRIVDLATRSKRDGIPAVMRRLRNYPPAAMLTARDHGAQTGVIAAGLSGLDVPVYIKTTSMPATSIRRPVQRFLARRLYRRADGVIAISSGVAEAVASELSVPRSLINVIYDPVITRDFDARLRAAVGHEWLQDRREVPVILAAARFAPEKDLATLMRAFARLRQWRPARLVLVGDGEGRAELGELIQALGIGADCDMPGVVPDPVPLMRASDLFAFSSRSEGLGNVLIEALAAGTRLVSTDCPSGPAETLDQGRYGRLVPVGDYEAFARAMHQSLSEPAPEAKTVETACQRFRAEAVARSYLQTMKVTHAG